MYAYVPDISVKTRLSLLIGLVLCKLLTEEFYVCLCT